MGTRKVYTEEFKKQIVSLVNSGKTMSQVSREYDVSKSSVYYWVTSYNKTKSFRVKDNRTEEEKELLELEKENKQLRMEVDILKQAALIMGQKSK